MAMQRIGEGVQRRHGAEASGQIDRIRSEYALVDKPRFPPLELHFVDLSRRVFR